MKKSSTFMIGYVVFLFISPLVCVAFHSNMIIQISLAATIAGYFFAISDIFYFTSDQWLKEIPYYQKELAMQQQCLVDCQTTLKRLIPVIETAMKVENPIAKKESSSQATTFVKLKKLRNDIDVQLSKVKRHISTKHEKGNERNLIEVIASSESTLGNCFLVFGFLVFLSICMFSEIATYLISAQYVSTIYGFGLIMLFYILRDNSDLIIKKKMAKYEKNVEYLVVQSQRIEKLSGEVTKLENKFNKN